MTREPNYWIMRTKITRFFGETLWLSNFYFVDIVYKGDTYPTLEHAYQASKFKQQNHRTAVQRCKYPGDAKRYAWAHKDEWRSDWLMVNVTIMEKLLHQKFGKDHVTQLWKRLKDTGEKKLIEGNTWNDRFWGMHRDPDGKLRGKNMLGKLLMEIRSQL